MDPRVDRTRVTVLRTVRDMLIEQGWESVTHAAVAQRSGVGRTTVYRHWPGRGDLIHDAMDLELDVTRDQPVSGDLRADLVVALESIEREMTERQGSRFLVAMIARSEFDDDARNIKTVLVRRALQGLRCILADAVRDGRLPGSRDVSLAMSQLVGPMVMRHLVTAEPVDRGVLTRLVDDLLIACRADPEAAGGRHANQNIAVIDAARTTQ